MRRPTKVLRLLVLTATLLAARRVDAASSGAWRNVENQAILESKTLKATFQAGLLSQLQDRATGAVLVSIDPVNLPSDFPIFGPKHVDLDTCQVSITSSQTEVVSRIEAPDGVVLQIQWKVDAASDDLVVSQSAELPQPISVMQSLFFGCEIAKHKLVAVDSNGVGHQFSAPWTSKFIGDPRIEESPMSGPAPLVALFDGQSGGWLIEGRDARIGPSNVMACGVGDRAIVSLVSHFPIATKTPRMYPMRVRVYRGRWERAVDPYIDWMAREAGYTPLAALPKERAWVNQIRVQAYAQLGDFESLEALAKRVDPKQTLLGRFYGWRVHADNLDLPDYHVSETARKWFGRAHELGFHVGAGFSAFLVSNNRPDLVERFRPGFAEIGAGKDGKPLYHTLPPSPSPIIWEYYCTPALKSYRDYFVDHVKDAVDAGCDVIYLDEAAWPSGKSVVDGMSSTDGLMQMERDILERYPNVAIETEQFNPVASRHACFGLSQMFLGHPLGGYIFKRFLKIAPEGIVHGPTEGPYLDAFQSYGYILPGVSNEKSWLQIARVFQDDALEPDDALTDTRFDSFVTDRSGGLVPKSFSTGDGINGKRFGYRGANGAIAYFQRNQNKQGMVVYEPSKPPRWVGTRVVGVTSWAGPGVLKDWIHPNATDTEADWFLYDGQTQIGLNGAKTYRLDESASFPQERFHVTRLPDDFAIDERYPTYLRPIEVGRDGSFFRLIFRGNGQMAAYVPKNVQVYLDGAELPVDREKHIATFDVTPHGDQFDVLTAFPQTATPLVGRLVDLPWQVPPCQRTYFVKSQSPNNTINAAVTGMIVLNGALPKATHLRIRGSYKLSDETHVATTADGVIRINGKEIVRLPPGKRPFADQRFDADIGEFSNQHVLIELIPDGVFNAAPAEAEWRGVEIVAGN